MGVQRLLERLDSKSLFRVKSISVRRGVHRKRRRISFKLVRLTSSNASFPNSPRRNTEVVAVRSGSRRNASHSFVIIGTARDRKQKRPLALLARADAQALAYAGSAFIAHCGAPRNELGEATAPDTSAASGGIRLSPTCHGQNCRRPPG